MGKSGDLRDGRVLGRPRFVTVGRDARQHDLVRRERECDITLHGAPRGRVSRHGALVRRPSRRLHHKLKTMVM